MHRTRFIAGQITSNWGLALALLFAAPFAVYASVTLPADASVMRIAGHGRTLMPGLSDVHVHLTFGALSQAQLADLLLVDGNPLTNIDLVGDAKHFSVIVKDGVIVKGK